MKVGDKVTRLIGGTVQMELVITEITENLIVCGAWAFDRKTGAEIDDDLGWGPKHGFSGSFLKGPL